MSVIIKTHDVTTSLYPISSLNKLKLLIHTLVAISHGLERFINGANHSIVENLLNFGWLATILRLFFHLLASLRSQRIASRMNFVVLRNIAESISIARSISPRREPSIAA